MNHLLYKVILSNDLRFVCNHVCNFVCSVVYKKAGIILTC